MKSIVELDLSLFQEKPNTFITTGYLAKLPTSLVKAFNKEP